VNNKLTHTETGVTRNVQVTTKPEGFQSSLGPTNLLDYIVPFKNITTENLQIYYQNIQGLRWKSSEVPNFLYPNLPHILCSTEHHLNQHEIEIIQTENYTLVASFCRNYSKMDGVCIFVNKDLNFINAVLRKFSLEQDIAVCAVKLSDTSYNICVLSIYTALSVNFVKFLKKLKTILNLLYNSKTQFIICADININYLVKNKK